MELHKFPKLDCPFKRKTIGKRYLITPEFDDEFDWIFDEDTNISEKLDGSNILVAIEDSKFTCYSRNLHEVNETNMKYEYEAVKNYLDKNPDELKTNQLLFGEAVGLKIGNNVYNFDFRMFYPFKNVRKAFKFTFLPFQKSTAFQRLSEILQIAKSNLNPEVFKEGFVFYNERLHKYAKIRRDMFDWYYGVGHNEAK